MKLSRFGLSFVRHYATNLGMKGLGYVPVPKFNFITAARMLSRGRKFTHVILTAEATKAQKWQWEDNLGIAVDCTDLSVKNGRITVDYDVDRQVGLVLSKKKMDLPLTDLPTLLPPGFISWNAEEQEAHLERMATEIGEMWGYTPSIKTVLTACDNGSMARWMPYPERRAAALPELQAKIDHKLYRALSLALRECSKTTVEEDPIATIGEAVESLRSRPGRPNKLLILDV